MEFFVYTIRRGRKPFLFLGMVPLHASALLWQDDDAIDILPSSFLRTKEQLAEANIKLPMEKRQNSRPLVSPLTVTPVLGPSWAGNLNHHSVLNRNLIPGENVVIPSSIPQPSWSSMETFFKLQQDFEKNITRELQEATAELESECYRVSLRFTENLV